MPGTITIPRRFCGPPESGNGGYTAGSLARYVDGNAEVTLRRPPPLETPLHVHADGERVLLLDGEMLVAEAAPGAVNIEPPDAVPLDVAAACSARSPLRDRDFHPFPSCFVCGPDRAAGDGLRLFPGRVEGRDVFATPWVPDDTSDELIWAALDCPSSMCIYVVTDHPQPHVLGRMAARIDARPVAGAPHVIVSWLVAHEGRKVLGGSAIYAPDGGVCAVARATWIALQTA